MTPAGLPRDQAIRRLEIQKSQIERRLGYNRESLDGLACCDVDLRNQRAPQLRFAIDEDQADVDALAVAIEALTREQATAERMAHPTPSPPFYATEE